MLLLLTAAALAQDAEVEVPSLESAEPAALPKEWEVKSFVSPDVGIAGATNENEEPFSLAFGGSFGVKALQHNGLFFGLARLHADWTIGVDKRGHQVKLGIFGGLHTQWWGLEIGLDGWRNRYDLEDFSLAPTFGLDVPLQVAGGPRQAHVVAGVAVAAVTNPLRQVDWNQAQILGFGHEFKRWIGIQTRVKGIVLGLVYFQRQVQGELVQGFTVSATQ